MFFSLSGFLVAGSLERCRTLVSFAGLRVMRIFPALVVETLLSAFILGPLLTQVSLPDYFGGSEFRLYMLNMLGFPHIFLPGLFAHNPATYVVNGQLWTVPYELRCYQVLLVIAAVGCYANKWAHLAVVSLLTLVVAVFVNPIRLESLAGNMLVLCFLWGTLWFRYRAIIPWSGALAIVAAVVSAAALSIRGGDVVATASLSYLTVYLGLLNPPRNRLLFSGDYSYGLFLYGFPVQQAIATWGDWTHHWYILGSLGLAFTAIIAAGSWWFIEKPILARKAVLITIEDQALAMFHATRNRWSRRAAGAGAPFAPSTIGPAKNRER